MNCECVERVDGLGYDTTLCPVHGPTGLRDQQRAAYRAWVKKHRVRNMLHQIGVTIRMPSFFPVRGLPKRLLQAARGRTQM